MGRTNNVGGVESYQRMQNEQASQVLTQTNYRAYEPANKPKAADADNFGRDVNPRAVGKKLHEDFQHTNIGMEKLRGDYTGYDHRSQKQSNLTSALDTPVERPVETPMYEEPKHVPNQAKDSQMVK